MDDPYEHSDILPFPRERYAAVNTMEPTRLGLLAGGGQFPLEFVRAAQSAGHSVFGLGVRGMATDELAAACDDFRFAPLARLGTAIRQFRKAGVQRIVMAGKIEKTVLYHPFRWVRMLPDWRTLHMWFRYARENKKDDTILLAIIREFERDGFTFDSALDYAPELLVKHGFLTNRKPTALQWGIFSLAGTSLAKWGVLMSVRRWS